MSLRYASTNSIARATLSRLSVSSKKTTEPVLPASGPTVSASNGFKALATNKSLSEKSWRQGLSLIIQLTIARFASWALFPHIRRTFSPDSRKTSSVSDATSQVLPSITTLVKWVASSVITSEETTPSPPAKNYRSLRRVRIGRERNQVRADAHGAQNGSIAPLLAIIHAK